MDQYPFFSVVIPTYDRAAFIEATLESVLGQTYQHYEIIVVDDCSTDNTEETLQPYVRAGQVRYLKNKQQSERAQTRNTGLTAAAGDFATFLDSDDFMYPSNLADAAAYVRMHPEIKCFHNLYEMLDAQGNVCHRFPLPPLKNQIRAITNSNFMACIGNFVHREIYQHYQFDTYRPLSGVEDWDYWLRVLADYKVGRIEKINSGILHHGGRSVNNQNLRTVEVGLEHLVEKIATDAHLSEIYRPYLKQIRAHSLLYIAMLANGGGLFGEARKYLVKAVNIDFRLLANPRLWRVARRACLRLQPQYPNNSESAAK